MRINNKRRLVIAAALSIVGGAGIVLACGPLSVRGNLAEESKLDGSIDGSNGETGPPLATCTPGELDPTFGTNGTAIIVFTGNQDQVRRIALDSQGRILFGGITPSEDGGTYAFVGRALPNGKRDDSFGQGGRALITYGTFTRTQDIVVLPDGRIVVALVSSMQDVRTVDAGESATVEAPFMAVARLTPDGQLDPGFDGGLVNDTDNFDHNIEIVPTPDGKLIIGGTEDGRFMIVRLNGDGRIDTTFSPPNGIQRQLTANAQLAEIYVDTDGGSITMFGEAAPENVGSTGPWGIGIVRVRNNSSGDTLDPSLGDGGVLIAPIGGSVDVQRIAIDSDHKMTVASTLYQANTNGDLLLTRFEWNGSLDKTFGDGGLVLHALSSDLDRYTALAFDGQGRLVALGRNEGPRGEPESVFVARYEKSGALDKTFGDGGIASHRFGFDDDGDDMVLQPDGKIVIAIEQSNPQNNPRVNLLVRLCP